MDSIIRQAVREELRRSSSSRPETASSTNQDDQGRSENESGAAGSSRSSFSSRTVGRLSGLLNRMRKGGGKESSSKKRKVVKEHRIQVRWLHYDAPKKAFVPVRLKTEVEIALLHIPMMTLQALRKSWRRLLRCFSRGERVSLQATWTK